MTTHTIPAPVSTSATPARLGGLDGLRALAVGLVVVYHLFPAALPGGFLGVDVFFAISGFLITTLLLAEYRRAGRLALGSFWRRRARRLLPALAFVLLICTSVAVLVDSALLAQIGAQLVGASFFVANWVYIGLGSDYFAQENPELFRNTWSLAIEEQFYVLLPLALILALRLRSQATRTLLFAVAGMASALWMAALFREGSPATRVYFGTDTHVFGLLLGAALACALAPAAAPRPRPTDALTRSQQLALIAIGVAGLSVLGWLSVTLREGSPDSFTGGFQLATLSVLVTVWAATRPGAWLGRALDVAPLRWIGERSYGIYLWHWPLLLIVAALGQRAGAAGWSVPALTLLITICCAALSYRFVEQPVRRLGLRAALARVLRPARLPGSSRWVAGATALLTVVTLPTTAYAIATAPEQRSEAAVIARGQAHLEAQNERRGSAQTAPSQPTPTMPSQQTTAGETLGPAGIGSDWAQVPRFDPPKPQPIAGAEIVAIGDSVMLASAPELADALPNIWIDAAVSRGLGNGVGIAAELAARGELRPVLVVGLGTNGPVDNADLDELVRVADGRRIVLVNAYADRWWVPEVNQQLRTFADAHRGVTLADWAGTIPQVPGGLAGDDIHPNPSGAEAYANAVQSALDALLERNEQPLPASGKQR